MTTRCAGARGSDSRCSTSSTPSDLHNEIELLLAEGDLVAAHQRWTGTHGGEFAGVAATGKAVEFTSTAVLKIRDGEIAAAWDEVDMVSILQQLGALPGA